ncbi:MAG: BamA/TamA family outer membrane protein [Phycisphaeraceae bacterium]|nr:BamA/TamA family outer membrane protein [Phycisphaeraceae bacterium]
MPRPPSIRGSRGPSAALLLALVAGLTLGSPARAGDDDAAIARIGSEQPVDWAIFEGRPIREVVLQRPGRGDRPRGGLDERTYQYARNQLRLVEGTAFGVEQAELDLRSLNRLGRFGTVQSQVQQLADGSVRLTYTLDPQPIVQAVQTVGNRRFDDDELLGQLGLIEGAPVDRFTLDRLRRRIEDTYREAGYYLVKVDWDEEALVESGIVLFRIQEGDIVRIGQIRFEGNASVAPGTLHNQISSEAAWLLGRGYVNDDKLDLDVAAIVDYYRSRGFLDVRADRIVRPSPNGREVIVTFLIDEGEQFTLRNVGVFYPTVESESFETEGEARAALDEGEELIGVPLDEGFRYVVFRPEPFTSAQVEGLIKLKRGAAYGTRDADESVEDVLTALYALGHADARVNRVERRAIDSAEVDLILQIVPGPAYRTGLVQDSGNDITQGRVVRRQITTLPDRPLDRGEMNESVQRIQSTNLFQRDQTTGQSSVRGTILPPDQNDPLYRDVLYEVQETNTGRFNFGAAVDSDAGLTGRFSVEQRNFDLYDWPESWGDLLSGRAFRGAGQTARLELLPGTRFQTYAVSLSEPALFESDYSGSASLFYRSRNYRQYDEERLGTRWTLARRFGTRWTGNSFVRLEQVGLSDLEPDSPTDFYDVADDSVLLGFGAGLVRTDVDDRVRPTRGSRTELSIEQVVGDFNFTRLSAEHTIFLAIREDLLGRQTIVSMRTAAGWSPQGQDEVPTYERFYLGGRSFRGFDYRGVSPRGIRADNAETSDEAVGGSWSFFWGVELEQPLYEELLSGVVFLDTGTVEEDIGFDEYRVSVGLGIRVSVPALSQVPLAFDFGFPIVKQDADEERLFSFSLDIPF